MASNDYLETGVVNLGSGARLELYAGAPADGQPWARIYLVNADGTSVDVRIEDPTMLDDIADLALHCRQKLPGVLPLSVDQP